MRIVIIGSGNVATVLGRLCIKNSHQVVQVISRNVAHAKLLADELGCAYADFAGSTDTTAELFLIAVNDAALQQINSSFHFGNKLALHTAGSVSKDVLKPVSVNYGVLYPLQSIRKEMMYDNQIPFLVDGNTEETKTLIEDFAKTISTEVAQATDDERLKLHVAAVVVSNFTNHLYALAEDFCNKEKVDFKLLTALIKETAARVDTISPSNSQTGPAVRKDVFTLEKHIRLLTEYPRLKQVYLKLTDSIMNDKAVI